MASKTRTPAKPDRRQKIPRPIKHNEDVDAYRTDDGKPPMEESQCNIQEGDSKEDD